ncbi:hypothetical protein NSE_0075 [Neorickettsia sennetsu str. Miyayama]|uniref:Uncharacterized protein n=1 Tax=Ehrlichia sennetsu (strain ATCC VR-367 / Miyayama) TaxID=222891 RepID=Q2GEX0_EHRS3|nr:hypothetical protein NSE_0075 [Neorickettsia sennetsu str. Miyayama]
MADYSNFFRYLQEVHRVLFSADNIIFDELPTYEWAQHVESD